MDLNLLLFSFIAFAAISFGAVYDFYNRKIMGKTVVALLKAQAFSEEKAISPKQINIKKSSRIAVSIKKGNLSKVVSSLPDGRLYICEENRFKAESIYSQDKSSVKMLFCTIIVAALLAALIYIFAPEIKRVLNKI